MLLALIVGNNIAKHRMQRAMASESKDQISLPIKVNRSRNQGGNDNVPLALHLSEKKGKLDNLPLALVLADINLEKRKHASQEDLDYIMAVPSRDLEQSIGSVDLNQEKHVIDDPVNPKHLFSSIPLERTVVAIKDQQSEGADLLNNVVLIPEETKEEYIPDEPFNPKQLFSSIPLERTVVAMGKQQCQDADLLNSVVLIPEDTDEPFNPKQLFSSIPLERTVVAMEKQQCQDANLLNSVVLIPEESDPSVLGSVLALGTEEGLSPSLGKDPKLF